MSNHNEKPCTCHTHTNADSDKHNHCNCSCHHDEHHHEDSHKQCNNHSHDHGCSCTKSDTETSHCQCGCGHEHHKKSRTDILRYSLSLVLFAVSLIPPITPAVSIIIKISAILICGYKIIYHGILSLFRFKYDENTLMSVASAASCIMGDWGEAYLIVLLFSIAEYLEEYAVEKSNKRIESLIDSTAEEAYDEEGNIIPANSIKTGDRILVRPGDKLCTDAEIIKGNSSFDTSNITGESLPVDLGEGQIVVSGYINTGNAIVCKAISDYANSTTAKIKEYVKNARTRKASTEKFITKFAKIYTPVVICTAIVLGFLLYVFGISDISDTIRRVLTFMIASCPCALVISIPLSYYAAIGSASKIGILIKGSKHINTLAKADGIAFDKTGTITEGKLAVKEVVIAGDKTEEEILNYANALEIHSSHPIAKAICKAATETTYKAENVKEHFGKGIEGTVNGHKVMIGNSRLISEGNEALNNGLVVSIDEKDEAVIKLSDTLKADAKETLDKLLKKTKIKSAYILSGDCETEVKQICAQLGNISGYSNLLPNEKARKIEEIKTSHKAIIYVGDGVNDAPSLAKADFSISIGQGSSLALETGDATLITGSLKAIPAVIMLAKQTTKVVYTNIVFSLLVKAIVLVMAILGIAPIWFALFADVGVLILAVINSLSILYKKF